MLTLKSYNLYDLKINRYHIPESNDKLPNPICCEQHNKRKLKIDNWIILYKDDIDKIIEEFIDMLFGVISMSKYLDDIYYISFSLQDIKNDFLTFIFNCSNNSYKNDINYKNHSSRMNFFL